MIEEAAVLKLHESLLSKSIELGFKGGDLMAFLSSEIISLAVCNDMPNEVFDGLCDEIKRQHKGEQPVKVQKSSMKKKIEERKKKNITKSW